MSDELAKRATGVTWPLPQDHPFYLSEADRWLLRRAEKIHLSANNLPEHQRRLALMSCWKPPLVEVDRIPPDANLPGRFVWKIAPGGRQVLALYEAMESGAKRGQE